LIAITFHEESQPSISSNSGIHQIEELSGSKKGHLQEAEDEGEWIQRILRRNNDLFFDEVEKPYLAQEDTKNYSPELRFSK